MKFVVIVVALLLLQWWGSGAPLQRDHWFWRWWSALQQSGSLSLRLTLAVAIPAFVVWVFSLWLAATWYGLPLFALELLILLYSLGRGDFRLQLNEYLERWRRGDQEAAYQQARNIGDLHGLEKVDNAGELHQRVRTALLYQGLERWFAVVFWFALAGPAAALAYRLLQLLASGPRTEAAMAEADTDYQLMARAILNVADWIPARLLGLSFALIGNFTETMQVWRQTLVAQLPTEELMVCYQQAAQMVPLSADLSPEQYQVAAERELNDLTALLSRAVVLWIVALAVLQLL